MSWLRRLRRLFAKRPRPPEERSYALNQLDMKLRPFLDFRNGFFIEAGANDGISQSNTLHFEESRGWSGILVEPVPELAERCRVNRPRCTVEACALVSFDHASDWVEMRYCGLMSLVKGALKSTEAELLHVEEGCEIQGLSTYELEVPAKTLTSILDKHSVDRVDLLSLDVEGYELDVLKGIDFNRHRPTFLLVEARFRDEIEAFLSPFYDVVAEFPPYDILYKCREAV